MERLWFAASLAQMVCPIGTSLAVMTRPERIPDFCHFRQYLVILTNPQMVDAQRSLVFNQNQ
jgi:hypothetical protein